MTAGPIRLEVSLASPMSSDDMKIHIADSFSFFVSEACIANSVGGKKCSLPRSLACPAAHHNMPSLGGLGNPYLSVRGGGIAFFQIADF